MSICAIKTVVGLVSTYIKHFDALGICYTHGLVVDGQKFVPEACWDRMTQ